jgi:hypothetical protein
VGRHGQYLTLVLFDQCTTGMHDFLVGVNCCTNPLKKYPHLPIEFLALYKSNTYQLSNSYSNACRKSKLRCTKDRPACQHCRRTGTSHLIFLFKAPLPIGCNQSFCTDLSIANNLPVALECVYEKRRVKPGIKSGAVDNIHKRLGNVIPLSDGIFVI